MNSCQLLAGGNNEKTLFGILLYKPPDCRVSLLVKDRLEAN